MSNNLLDQIAGFTWNERSRRYDIEVLGFIVTSVRTIREVKAFSAMHHDGFIRGGGS